MVVPESLKLNKFKVVKIPSNREIYDRFGKASQITYSGDTVCNFDSGKIAQMEAASKLNDGKLADEMVED